MDDEKQLTLFLYALLRDKLPSSDVVDCVHTLESCRNNNKTPIYTSKHLAEHAQELAARILKKWDSRD